MTQNLFDSGDEPPEVDDSGGECKTESEGEERARKELEDEHAQWEREHSTHLSAIETPISQRAQPDSGDEGFIVSSANETIFDSQDSDYRASTTEESDFQTASENADSDYQDRLAIVVRNSVEEVADDDEPKPSPEASPKQEDDDADAHDVSNCSNIPVKGTPTPRSRRETPARATSATRKPRSSRRRDKRTGRSRRSRERSSRTRKGKRDSRKQRTRNRKAPKHEPSSRRYKPRKQEFNDKRFKRMGHRRSRTSKDEERVPPYRMAGRERDYLGKLKKVEKYKYKGRRWKGYLKKKHRRRRYYSSEPSSSSSSDDTTRGQPTIRF